MIIKSSIKNLTNFIETLKFDFLYILKMQDFVFFNFFLMHANFE